MYVARMAGRRTLDLRVGARLGVPEWQVERITSVFIEEIRRELVESGAVRLDNLGVIRVFRKNHHGGKNLDGTPALPTFQYRITFSKSVTLKRALQGQLPRGAKWQPKKKTKKA